MRGNLALLLLAAAAAHAAGPARPKGPPKPADVPGEIASQADLQLVVKGLRRPVALTFAPGDAAGRLFIVEQAGIIRILRGGALDPRPFLDISRLVTRAGNEQGLLGLAFHPRFAQTGRLYVNYSNLGGDTRVVEYHVDENDPDRVDAASARVLLKVKRRRANHNGGNLIFGPDARLWIGLGDGGGSGDPLGNGQNPRTPLGKMLRIDVDAASPLPEIVMFGLRNPWRYSFDRVTGDLYIADVGQELWEEIDILPRADALRGGQNFGWNRVEGMGHCFPPRVTKCAQEGLTLPALEYGHDQGCSVTGGFVYRGKAIPSLAGLYFYADYCTAFVRSLRWRDGVVTDTWDWKTVLDPKNSLAEVSSFGEDADGELYLVTLDGRVFRLVPRARP